MLLIFSGGIGRFTKKLVDMVEEEGMNVKRTERSLSSCSGLDAKGVYVTLENLSSLVGDEKKKLLVDEEQMMRYNRTGGEKSEVESLLTEADIFLEIFLYKLKVLYGDELLPPIRLFDRHSIPSHLILSKGLTIVVESASTNTGENIMFSLVTQLLVLEDEDAHDSSRTS